MAILSRLFACGVLVACATVVGAQEKQIKHIPPKPTSAASGQEMFVNYCAVCHGKDGKGGGPAAEALKAQPTDLTVLAQKNGGTFPAARVSAVLRGQANLRAHGNQEMPVWGPVFWKMGGGSEGEVTQRIANLTKYVESLQVK